MAMEIILIIIYGLALLFIFCYSLIQLNLVFKYRKYKNSIDPIESYEEGEWPKVSIQLPIFNEKYVANRLIEAVSNIDYPKEKLEIQVLDDSTDETLEIVAKKVAEVAESGVDICLLHRTDRSGFKAGALAEGLKTAKGEFVALFDADFLPGKDFLKQLIPKFKNKKVGMIQSRWEHLNRKYSLLTKMQAFGLDAHFSVEQGGRNAGNHFINFNGTAGIWRKETINDAGGWQSDTLTEDLDLSYRAQLKGWKFLFVESVGAPAELPAAMNALKTQQFRWNKGAAECVRKNLWKVLRSQEIGISTKLHAIFHLMNSSIFICIVILALLSIPMLYIKESQVEWQWLFKAAGFFLISLPILAFFYWTSMKNEYSNNWKAAAHFTVFFSLFLSISMGLSLHNALAVLEGYRGKKSPFIRTPKFNLTDDSSKKWIFNVYLINRFQPLTILEFLFALYFLGGIVLGIHYKDYGLIPFHFLLLIGFSYVAFLSFRHSLNFRIK